MTAQSNAEASEPTAALPDLDIAALTAIRQRVVSARALCETLLDQQSAIEAQLEEAEAALRAARNELRKLVES